MPIHKDQRFRRHQDWKAKEKAKQVLKHSWGYDTITPRHIGMTASVHGKPCSCWGCGNPRKWFGERTVQERRYAP